MSGKADSVRTKTLAAITVIDKKSEYFQTIMHETNKKNQLVSFGTILALLHSVACIISIHHV